LDHEKRLESYLSASGDSIKENLFGCSASQGHAHAVIELFFTIQVLLFGQVLGVAQAFTARND